MRSLSAVMGILTLFLAVNAGAAANEISPLVTKLFSGGVKNFTCEIVGRELLKPAVGFDDMAPSRNLQPRAILASTEDEALKMCLQKVNASLGYGPKKVGGGVLFVIFLRDIPELKSSKSNLFIADDIKVQELKAF